MPDIKLRDGSGVEQTYTGVDTITVPLADGSGNYTYGYTDEDLTFIGKCRYIVNDLIATDKNNVLSRIKLLPDSNGKLNIYNLIGTTFDFDVSKIKIDCTDVTLLLIGNVIVTNTITTLPTVIGDDIAVGADFINICSSNPNYIKQDEIEQFFSHFGSVTNETATGGNTSQMTFTFTSNAIYDTSIICGHINRIINDPRSYKFNSISVNMAANNIYLYKNVPVWGYKTCTLTSNDIGKIINSYTSYKYLSNFTFSMNGSNVYEINAKSQVLDFSSVTYTRGYSGESYSNASNNPYMVNNIFTANNMTIEQAQARYDELKGVDNWYSECSNSVSYNGKTVRLSSLFSRYNHDSAVETINSLPDTSEYLATAGGTNTIKFLSYAGALTDDGACGDLTEEEIAVATAKGWTVTLV